MKKVFGITFILFTILLVNLTQAEEADSSFETTKFNKLADTTVIATPQNLKSSGAHILSVSKVITTTTTVIYPDSFPVSGAFNDSLKVSVSFNNATIAPYGFLFSFSNCYDSKGFVGKIICNADLSQTTYTISSSDSMFLSSVPLDNVYSYNGGLKGIVFRFYNQSGTLIGIRSFTIHGGNVFAYGQSITIARTEPSQNHYSFTCNSSLIPKYADVKTIDCRYSGSSNSLSGYPCTNQYGRTLSNLNLPEVLSVSTTDKQVVFYFYYWDGGLIDSSLRTITIPKQHYECQSCNFDSVNTIIPTEQYWRYGVYRQSGYPAIIPSVVNDSTFILTQGEGDTINGSMMIFKRPVSDVYPFTVSFLMNFEFYDSNALEGVTLDLWRYPSNPCVETTSVVYPSNTDLNWQYMWKIMATEITKFNTYSYKTNLVNNPQGFGIYPLQSAGATGITTSPPQLTFEFDLKHDSSNGGYNNYDSVTYDHFTVRSYGITVFPSNMIVPDVPIVNDSSGNIKTNLDGRNSFATFYKATINWNPITSAFCVEIGELDSTLTNYVINSKRNYSFNYVLNANQFYYIGLTGCLKGRNNIGGKINIRNFQMRVRSDNTYLNSYNVLGY